MAQKLIEIADVPVIEIDGHIAKCDGSHGGLFHPMETIKLKRHSAHGDNIAVPCRWCGVRYKSKI